MKENIIKQVADQFTDTFGKEIRERLIDQGLEGTPEEVEAVTDVIAKIYK
tara:strand:- start:185 stop:334 length:150 start_codon:yes stop_codon:yes gene_type:complete